MSLLNLVQISLIAMIAGFLAVVNNEFSVLEIYINIIKLQDDHRTGMIRRVEKGRMPGKVNWGYLPVYEAGKLSGYTIDDDNER